MKITRHTVRHPVKSAAKAKRRREDLNRLPAPFVVGVNRSGTTLLRLMLDAHPQLAIPPETHFVPEVIRIAPRDGGTRVRMVRRMTRHARWGDFGLDAKDLRTRVAHVKPARSGPVLRAFYELYAESQGKPRWGDKTPRYMRAMPRIQRALPEARFIHIIRDGRDVAVSQNERALDGDTVSMAEAAARWRRRINTARVHAADLPDAYREVRYEDLVSDAEATLRGICDYIELPFDEGMLRYYEHAGERLEEIDRDLGDGDERPVRAGSERLEGHSMTLQPPSTERCGRWRDEMSAADAVEFERIAGDLLRELGYETGTDTAAGNGDAAAGEPASAEEEGVA